MKVKGKLHKFLVVLVISSFVFAVVGCGKNSQHEIKKSTSKKQDNKNSTAKMQDKKSSEKAILKKKDAGKMAMKYKDIKDLQFACFDEDVNWVTVIDIDEDGNFTGKYFDYTKLESVKQADGDAVDQGDAVGQGNVAGQGDAVGQGAAVGQGNAVGQNNVAEDCVKFKGKFATLEYCDKEMVTTSITNLEYTQESISGRKPQTISESKQVFFYIKGADIKGINKKEDNKEDINKKDTNKKANDKQSTDIESDKKLDEIKKAYIKSAGKYDLKLKNKTKMPYYGMYLKDIDTGYISDKKGTFDYLDVTGSNQKKWK